ncbi:CENP-B N-terminal DNA-binding domain [Popillia japonica]|uniref:CENP-B N-terminal DNA-binding domain n=1 Tax=Popillia japonica TaxID=7064 RepID=A0AAW1JZZ1_POPJA
MVRTYQKRNLVHSGPYKRPINAIKKAELTITKAAKQYGVPKTCLLRRIKSNNITAPRNDNYKQVFTEEQEQQLVKHILDMEARFYGLTPTDIRTIAFQAAENMKISHPFNKEKRMAGVDWLYNFRKRHPNLSLGAPEPTSVARAAGFSKIEVTKFFDLLSSVMKKYKFQANQIYNPDETGINTVPNPRNSCTKSLEAKREKDKNNKIEDIFTWIPILMSGEKPADICAPSLNIKAGGRRGMKNGRYEIDDCVGTYNVDASGRSRPWPWHFA